MAQPGSDSDNILPFADFLRHKGSDIIQATLREMKTHAQLGSLRLRDGDRIDHLPGVFTRMAALVESPDQSDRVEESLREAAHHGAVRKRQGYSGDMLVEDRRLLGKAIYDLVKANPSALDANRVVADLQRVNEILDLQLKVALVAHGQTEVAA